MLIDIDDPLKEKQEKASQGIALGIDLGTTFSAVSIIKDDKAALLNGSDGDIFLPSAIALDDGDYFFGHKAQELIAKGKPGIENFKRSMEEPEEIIWQGKTAIELSAMLLEHMIKRAKSILKEDISGVVISVPAYFHESGRQATKEAAKLAGLKVLRIINEPTSAALAYGLDTKKLGTFLVYDLGGGTFDVSVLKLHKGIFQVKTSLGDTKLGGHDIDQDIAQFWHKPELTTLARQAKEYLATHDNWHGQGLSLNRIQLEEISKSFFEKTLKITRQALKETTSIVDGLVLVGGSTRLYGLKNKLEKALPDTPVFSDLDPDRVVAYGAARQAHALTVGDADHLLLDITPLSLGIETYGGIVEKIITRNTSIPVSVAQDFTTFIDGQTAIKINIVQGEREQAKDCICLGSFDLKNIPPMPAGAAKVRVNFTFDTDGLLSIKATDIRTGNSEDFAINANQELEQTEIRSIILESHKHSSEDIVIRMRLEAKTHAEQILHHLNIALQSDQDLLEKDQLTRIEKLADKLKLNLDTSDAASIKDLVEELSHASQDFAQKRINRAIQKSIVGKSLN